MIRPFHIVAPPYTHKSSGVRTLHRLMSGLKERGYIFHAPADRDAIVVYPDITKGNPLRAKRVVRYLLASAGAYGGSNSFPHTDMVWGAHVYLAKNVLTIPVSDPRIFRAGADVFRQGGCFYAYKYEMHGHKLPDLMKGMSRLEGSLEQVASILRHAKRCYVFELSSVIQEAALCNCPVVLMRTPYFNRYDAGISLMIGNMRWSDEDKPFCDMTAQESHAVYADAEARYQKQLDDFITRTQEYFA